MNNNAAVAAASQNGASGIPTQGNTGSYFAIASAVTALSQLAGGFTAAQSGSAEAQRQEEQARLSLEESRRDAALRARDIQKFKAQQSHTYAASGFTLAGTPALVLEETRRKGQEEIDAILAKGQAEASLIQAQASSTRSAGRNAMIGGAFSAIGTGVERYTLGKRLGLFGNTSASPSPLSPVAAPSPLAAPVPGA